MVFGTGQAGRALTTHLAGQGLAVRAVSRHQPPALDGGAEWRPADVTDPEATRDAAKGASVIYQCLNAPYPQWPELFPPLQHGVLAAAEAGRVRVAIGRASDFFGPGVTGGSALGERVFGHALDSRRADFIGNPDLPHTYSYVPDVAAGLATLGTDPRAAGQVWHLPGPPTVTTRALLDLLAAEVGHPVAIRSVPKLALRALGLVNPMMRELAEMAYQFNEPFILDTSKYESTFRAAGTPLADAVTATVAWYRARTV